MRVQLTILLLPFLASTALAQEFEPVPRSSSPRGFSYDLYAPSHGEPTAAALRTALGNNGLRPAESDSRKGNTREQRHKLATGGTQVTYAQLQLPQ